MIKLVFFILISVSRNNQGVNNNQSTETETEEIEVEEENLNESQQQEPQQQVINQQLPISNSPLMSVLEEINNYSTEQMPDPVPQQIITEMDRLNDITSSEGLRQRRVDYFEGSTQNDVAVTPTTMSEDIPDAMMTTTMPTTRDQLNVVVGTTTTSEEESTTVIDESATAILATMDGDAGGGDKGDEIRIKLKYLNDNVRSVTGFKNEAIGDFKTRSFKDELSEEKFVRLVFNGHVLQPDTKTLNDCGMFDNCVVHCLIHNRKPTSRIQPAQGNQNNESQQSQGIGGGNTNQNNNINIDDPNAQNGRIFVYFGMGCVSLALLFCWFCKYVSVFVTQTMTII